MDPAWLNPRLEQAKTAERTRLLAELGITDPVKAKSLIDAGLAAEAEKLGTAEKLAAATTKLTAAEAETQRYKTVTAAQAKAQMDVLSDVQRAFIAGTAGDDPAAQLNAIALARPTWGITAPAPVVVTPAAPVAPTSTAPAPTAPASVAVSPPNRKAEYEQLKKTNPHAASLFLNKFSAEIYPPA